MREYLENVRAKAPLIHNITNYVTVNDVANVLLACGGSPIMSDEAEDVEDITSVCGGLNINIGTLHKLSIEAMFRAGRKANELGHPVLLDPVGAGALDRVLHGYGAGTHAGTEAERDPRKYFRDQDAGKRERHYERCGCGCGRRCDGGHTGSGRCIC